MKEMEKIESNLKLNEVNLVIDGGIRASKKIELYFKKGNYYSILELNKYWY